MLGIMQPYFFPYLGHFALIARCERWVVFDITQFTRKSWMTRNRLLHPHKGWFYISVPIANASTSIKTSEARLVSSVDAQRSLLGKLAHYRRNAPFWSEVESIVADVFSQPTDSLVELNVRALRTVCRYLEIPFDPLIASTSLGDLPGIGHPGGWAPEICARLGESEYLNPIGGRAIFRLADFEAARVALKLLEFEPMRYPTPPWRFEESLSVLDVMMWNVPSAIREAISTHGRIIDAAISEAHADIQIA